ncbi:DMT family transporter [Piscirickettsia litoralis]|uniref:EamA domain-containing protein n=1 Tax=Piscirickettsia litoralis TaxID=1891921 RepID=A0ABX3A3H5_9GAMM|nr:DMT family transporter [Piscirickettsia litoralis]ODN42993.1 hypothetical protein BGC07_08740 [Piscirickettsia litoralis]
MKQNTLFALTLLILAQLMTGINITTSKYLVSHLPVLLLMQARFSIGALILLICLCFPKKSTNNINYSPLTSLSYKDWLIIFAQACCAGILFNILMLWGVQYTSASMAGIITSALPATITVFSIILLKEILNKFKLLCIGFATAGLLVINMQSLHFSTHSNLALWGDFLIILSLIPEALYYILTKLSQSNVSPITLAFLMNAINAVLMLPLMLLLHDPIHLTVTDWSILILSGVSSAFFYLFWFQGAPTIDGTTSGLMTALMPIFTLILSWAFLAEKISLLQATGMLLILLSIFFSTRSKKRSKQKVQA